MKALFIAAFLILGCTSLVAQTPAPVKHTNAIGFSYSLPADWQVTETQPTLSALKQEQSQNATSDEEKKGLACAQIALTARHGNPVSMIAITTLPFYCFGQPMTDKDLPGFAQAGLDDLKKSFDLGEPVYGAYSRGSHNMWIERVTGAVIGHAELHYTAEIVCSLLKNGAVCWMSMATDDAELRTFERGLVTLDGEAPVALVPVDAFVKKPS